MNWKLLVAVGAATGAVWWAARRRTLADAADADLWAAATDRVPPA
jgi:hypothetical protein